MTARIRWLALLALVLCPIWAHAASVEASLARNTVQLGETVTLNLHSDTGSFETPDFSVLSNDFAVLGQSSGQTMSFINGQRKVEFNVGVVLRPLHQGDLTIPALQVGGTTTQPLVVHVTAPSASAASTSNGPVFLEASVQPSSAYVGQQLALSVKLYYLANLANASLDDPRIDDVDVSRIGGDTNYQAERNGRIYNVIERRYVLVPQKPGELRIPPVQFQGDLLDPNDPDSFLGMGAPVSAQSTPLQVTVKPAPAHWGSAAWLPARKLSLTLDGLPDEHTPLRVGQPFNLTMTLEATGIPFEALPPLTLPDLEGATAYPDKPVTANRADSPWVVGRRQQAFAVVPEKAGTLTIPAISLKWWNVLTDQAETATIPAHTYTVQGAAGAAPPAPASPAVSAESGTAAAAAASSAGEGTSAAGGSWRWIALASLGVLLCLLLTLGWGKWRRRRTASPARPPRRDRAPGAMSSRECRRAFMQAAGGEDSQAQARTLLAWARSERPAIAHLEALSQALAAIAQREAIAALQRQRYAADPASAAGPALRQAFESGFEWLDPPGPGRDDDPLPPLYPFKLR